MEYERQADVDRENAELRASLAASEAGAAALRAALAIVVAVFEVRDRPGWCPRDMRDAIENAESSLATDSGTAVLRVLRAAWAYSLDRVDARDLPSSWDAEGELCEAVAALPPALRGAK